MSREEEVHQIGGRMGEMDTLGHLVQSHLSDRKGSNEHVASLRAMLELETFRMFDSIP